MKYRTKYLVTSGYQGNPAFGNPRRSNPFLTTVSLSVRRIYYCFWYTGFKERHVVTKPSDWTECSGPSGTEVLELGHKGDELAKALTSTPPPSQRP